MTVLLPFPAPMQAVLVAVTNQTRPTVRSVAMYAGVSVETAHRRLSQLRDMGFVEWMPEHAGTLRARVTIEHLEAGARR